MPQPVAFVLLVRSPSGWRTTVAEVPEARACGMLADVPADAPFEQARRRFEGLLRESWGVTDPVMWTRIKPDWWAAEMVPGSLAGSGEIG